METGGSMTTVELTKIIVTAIIGVLMPIVILIIGNWYTRQKERANENQRNADRLALLLKHLASDNTSERLLALQVVQYLHSKKEFPPELANTVTAIAFRDTPEVAGAALLILGGSSEAPDEVVLLELLAPLKVQFDRTSKAFKKWKARDEHTERIIKHSNEYIRELLISRAYLIPDDLQEEANQLVEHYNAWLAEYDRVYKDGVRDMNIPFVFVGPKGFPFPKEAEHKFLAKYEELRSNLVKRANRA
jgi:hypothetical protein